MREGQGAPQRKDERYKQMQRALQILATALKEPDGGSYWPARRFLTAHGVFHDDLSGTRVLLRVAQCGLGRKIK
jgi:hypothetical protein